MIELLMRPTGRRDRWGFRQYSLTLLNQGRPVDRLTVISGSSDRQYERFIHPRNDFSGSNRPIPEGIYRVGRVERGWWGSAIGEIWIGLEATPESKVNNRSAFGFHADYNRSVSGYQGSAGCVCPYDDLGIERIATWCSAEARPERLVVDYGLEFLSEIGYRNPIAIAAR
jgi:hypothetical protein